VAVVPERDISCIPWKRWSSLCTCVFDSFVV